MKVLLIGGTGNISTPATQELLKRGADVYHYNRGNQQVPEGVQSIVGDRNNHAAFEAQIRDLERFDCVIDMIGYQPEDAESCVRAFSGRTGQFIFCSTVDVYARPAKLPIREDSPLGGRNDYGRKKVLCEQIFAEAHQRGDLPVTVLRPAATYQEGWAFPDSFGSGSKLFDRIRKGKPVIVHGDGQAVWVETHRDDVGRAFAMAAGAAKTIGKAYNVMGDEWLTWDEIYQGIAAALGAPVPQLVHIPSELLARVAPDRASILLENFQFNNIFDTAAAREDLDFHGTVPFVEGVRRTVAHLDKHNAIEDCGTDPFYDQVIEAWGALGAQMASALRS